MASQVTPRPTGGATRAEALGSRTWRAGVGSRRLDGKSLIWIGVVLALVILHAIHPRADFPNHSAWMDDARFTDEGWYGKAAIDHYAIGSWYVPGDLNAAVLLPVLPALELAVFHFTGPGFAAARLLLFAVFAANLLLTYLVMRTQARRWTALLAVTLLAANAFVYAFGRLAILEPLLILFLLASWFLALRLPRQGASRYAILIASGLAMFLATMSKTTATFILPSTLYLLWKGAGPAFSARLRAILIAALAAILPWCAYYFVWVRPHYLADYRYFFIANQYGHPVDLAACIANLWYALHGTLWIGPSLAVLALALLLLSVVFFRYLWRNSLFIASLLATAGYIFFIAWHNNIQPRYYQVLAYPMIVVIALSAERLTDSLRKATAEPRPVTFARTASATAFAITLTLSTAANLRLITRWTLHPEYTWLGAANALTHYIDQHPNGNRLLLSISGDEITLATGLPAICDDYGSWELTDRIRHYQPGWYAAWNEIDEGTAADLATQYTLEQVATFNAFDDPDRDQLILYKLHPLKPEK